MNETAILLVGILIGVGLIVLYLAYRIKSIFNKIDNTVAEAIKNTLLGVNVEKHGSMYRFYNEKDGQFIMQTTTLDGLSTEFNRLYPTKTCYIAGGDPEVVNELEQVLSKK